MRRGVRTVLSCGLRRYSCLANLYLFILVEENRKGTEKFWSNRGKGFLGVCASRESGSLLSPIEVSFSFPL